MLQALKHLMQVLKANPEDAEAISLAIDAVAASSDDHLANQLIEFLLGETDGMPKVSTGRIQGTFRQNSPSLMNRKMLPLHSRKQCQYFQPIFFFFYFPYSNS
jgi:hypothetical protein